MSRPLGLGRRADRRTLLSYGTTAGECLRLRSLPELLPPSLILVSSDGFLTCRDSIETLLALELRRDNVLEMSPLILNRGKGYP